MIGPGGGGGRDEFGFCAWIGKNGTASMMIVDQGRSVCGRAEKIQQSKNQNETGLVPLIYLYEIRSSLHELASSYARLADHPNLIKGGSTEKLIVGVHMTGSPRDQEEACDPPALRTLHIRPSSCLATL